MDEETHVATTWADIKGVKTYYTVLVVQYLFVWNSTTTKNRETGKRVTGSIYQTQNSDNGLQQRHREKLMDEVTPGNQKIRMTLINQETNLLFPVTVNEKHFSG